MISNTQIRPRHSDDKKLLHKIHLKKNAKQPFWIPDVKWVGAQRKCLKINTILKLEKKEWMKKKSMEQKVPPRVKRCKEGLNEDIMYI